MKLNFFRKKVGKKLRGSAGRVRLENEKLNRKMDGYRIDKHAQVTLFIIIAIVLVGGIILYYSFDVE